MAIKSWERQMLSHVNNICDIRIGEQSYNDILVINMDLERNHIIGRLYHGEGQFISFFNINNAVIKDVY